MKPSDAFLFAKRTIVERIDQRLYDIQQEKLGSNQSINNALDFQIKELEDLRYYIRNVMLWKGRDGE